MHCPFCNLDPNKSRILTEGTYSYVMLSNPRLVVGHTLVIPKRHILNISELNTEELNEIYDLLVKFENIILKKIATGCDIRQNYRPFLKQDELKVDHVHFHLLPRTLEDDIFKKVQKSERELFHRMNEKDLTESNSLFKV